MPTLRLSILWRLRAGFGAVVLAVVGIGVAALVGLSSLTGRADTLGDQLDPLVRDSLTVKYNAANLNRDFLAIPALGGTKEAVDDFGGTLEEFNASLVQLRKDAKDPVDVAAVDAIAEKQAGFLAVIKQDEALL